MILTIRSTAGWLATAILLFRPAKGVDNPVDPTMSTDLKMALTHLNYMNSLSDEDLVYDFNKVMANPWKPGSVLNANAATWPLLMNTRQTVAQLNLGPCAMLAPHLHPRGTNLVVAVTGTTRTFMQSENGAIVRQTTLTPGKMTIFPQASVHSMYNEGEWLSTELHTFKDIDHHRLRQQPPLLVSRLLRPRHLEHRTDVYGHEPGHRYNGDAVHPVGRWRLEQDKGRDTSHRNRESGRF